MKIFKFIGKIIGVALALFGILVIILMISDSDKKSKSVESEYAKIESEYLDVCDSEDAFNLLMNINFLGMLVDTNKWNENDKKAANDACNYLRKNQELQNNGVYEVKLYKHYISDEDYDGWAVFLRYSRRDDDFNCALIRL